MKTFLIPQDVHKSTFHHVSLVDNTSDHWNRLKIEKKGESHREYTITKDDCAWLIDILEEAQKENTDEQFDRVISIWKEVEAEL